MARSRSHSCKMIGSCFTEPVCLLFREILGYIRIGFWYLKLKYWWVVGSAARLYRHLLNVIYTPVNAPITTIAGYPPLPRGHDHPVAWSPDQSKDLLQGFCSSTFLKICQKNTTSFQSSHEFSILGCLPCSFVGWLSELFGFDHPLCLEPLIYTSWTREVILKALEKVNDKAVSRRLNDQLTRMKNGVPLRTKNWRFLLKAYSIHLSEDANGTFVQRKCHRKGKKLPEFFCRKVIAGSFVWTWYSVFVFVWSCRFVFCPSKPSYKSCLARIARNGSGNLGWSGWMIACGSVKWTSPKMVDLRRSEYWCV